MADIETIDTRNREVNTLYCAIKVNIYRPRKDAELPGLEQSRAPLTETRARSALSAQCLKVSGFPLKLTFLKTRARSHSARALHIKKKFCEKLGFSPLTFFKSDHSRLRY
jgi:hypothetical protein